MNMREDFDKRGNYDVISSLNWISGSKGLVPVFFASIDEFPARIQSRLGKELIDAKINYAIRNLENGNNIIEISDQSSIMNLGALLRPFDEETVRRQNWECAQKNGEKFLFSRRKDPTQLSKLKNSLIRLGVDAQENIRSATREKAIDVTGDDILKIKKIIPEIQPKPFNGNALTV